MVKVSMSLSSDLVNKIADASRKRDLKKSQVVNRALKQYFETKEENSIEDGEDTEKFEDLETKLEDVKSVQDALLKKLGYHIKAEPETVKEESVKLLEEGETEEEEDKEEEEEEED